MTNKKSSVLVFFLIWVLIPSILKAGDTLVIRAKKIYTASGGIIEDGMILIKDGKILRVGKNFPVPENTSESRAKIIIPGLIDIHSHLGVYSVPGVRENEDGNEMTDPVTPQVRALDSFNFEDPALQAGREGGLTTIVSRPGSGNVIGGTSVAVKLKNAPADQMILKDICDLKMTIEGNPVAFHGMRSGRMPTTMMGVYHLARKAFIEARAYMQTWEQYQRDKEAGKEAMAPPRDIGKDALVMAMKRQIPVHIHINTASEIMSCIHLADEFKFELTLAHCQWAYLIKDELVKRLSGRKDVHFNVGPAYFFSDYENMLRFNNGPAILADAGLNVSLQVDAVSGRQPGQAHLLHMAKLCVRYGMKEDDALKAITIRAAEAADLEDRIGSIEEGKDADLVYLDGEPFEFLTSVERVMIDGKFEYQKKSKNTLPFQTFIPQSTQNLMIPTRVNNAESFAIQGGTIFTMVGRRIRDGIILVKNGKIEKIGKDIHLLKNVPVIDARDFVIMPGLISARSQLGIAYNSNYQSSLNEISKPLVPELEVKHAIEPQDPLFTASQKLGVTTLMITPGNMNAIGGQGVVIKTSGSVIDKMVVKDNAVMIFGLGTAAKRENRMPSTRMGIAAMLRQTLFKAKEYKDKIERLQDQGKPRPSPRDFSLEALIPVIKGEMPVMFHCERKDDILTALRITDEFNLKTILTGASEAYKVADEIKERNIPVVLEIIFRGGGNLEDQGFSLKNASILSKKGIPVNFTVGDYLIWYIPIGLVGADPLEIAAFSYKHGMSEEAALHSITIDAARIIGCENQIGSLEPGKDADILILRGHPFYTRSVPEAVFIDGKVVHQRINDEH